ncbi:MAG: hydrogenase expression/formation protein HypE [Syntrophothermus sp.]
MNIPENSLKEDGVSCPVKVSDYDKVLLAHGGGGSLSRQMIQNIFYPQFNNEILMQEHDGAVFEAKGIRFAFSTDSYVVQPLFFPGGDIGLLSVNGTVNDLSMCGSKPLYISAGFILEEGFPMEDLRKIVTSMKSAAEKASVQIITGDTKVVEHGKGDKIYINTSGIGILEREVNISPQNCREGDLIILSGSIADHGIAVLSARGNLEFSTTVKSDTAALNCLVDQILNVSENIHTMRDPTRGGLASSLNEIALKAKLGIEIDEAGIPVKGEVNAACEILGLDPLYIANEGKMLVFVPETDADKVLKKMQSDPLGLKSRIIGRVVKEHPGVVIMKTVIGTRRIIDMLSGEQLPRIC